jgi:hypothetical protein
MLAATYECKNTSSKCHSLKFFEVNGKKKKEETTATGGINILMMPNDGIQTPSWYWQMRKIEKN